MASVGTSSSPYKFRRKTSGPESLCRGDSSIERSPRGIQGHVHRYFQTRVGRLASVEVFEWLLVEPEVLKRRLSSSDLHFSEFRMVYAVGWGW